MSRGHKSAGPRFRAARPGWARSHRRGLGSLCEAFPRDGTKFWGWARPTRSCQTFTNWANLGSSVRRFRRSTPAAGTGSGRARSEALSPPYVLAGYTVAIGNPRGWARAIRRGFLPAALRHVPVGPRTDVVRHPRGPRWGLSVTQLPGRLRTPGDGLGGWPRPGATTDLNRKPSARALGCEGRRAGDCGPGQSVSAKPSRDGSSRGPPTGQSRRHAAGG